jgi:Acetyltransferase (GNAT) domain/Acetyltransferase (GNAT) family
VQGQGIGRQLLERCLAMAGSGVPQVRLVHESFNSASLGLYLRAGFRVVSPLLELERPTAEVPVAPPTAGHSAVRPATAADRARLVTRDGRAFGAPRPQSIDLYLNRGVALVAEHGNAITGYAFGIASKRTAYLGAASGDDADTVLGLATAVVSALGRHSEVVRALLPATDRRLVDGLLAAGFRVARACQYMVRGGGTAPPANYLLMNGDMM